jgi:hypothetical protein
MPECLSPLPSSRLILSPFCLLFLPLYRRSRLRSTTTPYLPLVGGWESRPVQTAGLRTLLLPCSRRRRLMTSTLRTLAAGRSEWTCCAIPVASPAPGARFAVLLFPTDQFKVRSNRQLVLPHAFRVSSANYSTPRPRWSTTIADGCISAHVRCEVVNHPGGDYHSTLAASTRPCTQTEVVRKP